MKALSLLQPWASLVIMGLKTVETRNWATAYRGPLLIHAGKSKAGQVVSAVPSINKYIPHFNALPFGQIIGKVFLDDIIRVEEFVISNEAINRLTLENNVFGTYEVGRFAWILTNPEIFEMPVPARGMLSLWDYPYNL